MKQTVFSYGCDITDAYRKLKHMASETLEEVGGDFNGQKLDSTMTLDDMFKAVTGRAKAEHEKLLKEQQDKYKQEEQKHKESIPSLVAEYIERGHKLNESTWDAWDECVPVRLNDLYRGMELDYTLRLVEMLDINGCDIKRSVSRV